MKNYPLLRFLNATTDDFTSDFGIKARRKGHGLFSKLIALALGCKIVVEKRPVLSQNQNYIFAISHYLYEDPVLPMICLKHNAYLLLGMTDQVIHNPKMYAFWMNGMVYVNKLDARSRQGALDKMRRVLNAGSSVMIFPEGGWNASENLLCKKLFSSPWRLSKDTGVQVVPICQYQDEETKVFYVTIGDPMDLGAMGKEAATELLRDTLAGMMYEAIEKHSVMLRRSELSGDIHLAWMEKRKAEYLKEKWTCDGWDENLTTYMDAADREKIQIAESMDKIVITAQNAAVMAPILVRREEEKKYDFSKYMHETWDRS